MCQYTITTYTCGHTIHERLRNSPRCEGTPCTLARTPINRISASHLCPLCNRRADEIQDFQQPNTRRRRNAQINPTHIATANAYENSRIRHQRNVLIPRGSVPPRLIRSHRIYTCNLTTNQTSRTPRSTPTINVETSQRRACGIPQVIKTGTRRVFARSACHPQLLPGWRWGRFFFLFYGLLFCFLLLYVLSLFMYLLEQLVLAHLVWRLVASK